MIYVYEVKRTWPITGNYREKMDLTPTDRSLTNMYHGLLCSVFYMISRKDTRQGVIQFLTVNGWEE